MVNLNDLETLLQLLMLLAKSGSEDKFLKRFESYIRQIMENGDTAIGPPGKPIEHLAGQKNLCSMRFKLGISNIRILFVYKDGLVYLLSSFYERQGHRNTEYSTHIPVAQARFAELM